MLVNKFWAGSTRAPGIAEKIIKGGLELQELMESEISYDGKSQGKVLIYVGSDQAAFTMIFSFTFVLRRMEIGRLAGPDTRLLRT